MSEGQGQDRSISFPEYLLNSSDEERQNYFHEYIVIHTNLKNAIDETVRNINLPTSQKIVTVIGPTGVGKTPLINKISERIFETQSQFLSINPGCIPIVAVEAQPPEKGKSFDFTLLFNQTLEKMNKPTFKNWKKHEYTEALIKALKLCQTKALIIDEANNILNSSDKMANLAVDTIKMLANQTNAAIVLVGTYKLLSFLTSLETEKTDQFIRRCKIVDFQRYHDDSNETDAEFSKFGGILKNFFIHVPIDSVDAALYKREYKYFYDGCLGCIGLLKLWFDDAFSKAIDSGSRELKMEHFEKTKIPMLKSLLQTAENGEALMNTIFGDSHMIIKKGEDLRTKEKSYNPQMGAKKRGRPQRNPHRDEVGKVVGS